MENQLIKHHVFDNGLILIGEDMPWLESAAFSISIPAGCQHDPAEKIGLAGFTSEMVQRGCGERNSREFVESLEWLGVDDSSSVSVYFSQFSAAMPATALREGMEIFADVMRRPHLPDDQFEDGRLVCMQEVRSIEDDLSHKAMIELRQRYYGDPVGRNSAGTQESVASINPNDVQSFFDTYYRPNGLLISVAGKIDWDDCCKTVGDLFEDWQPAEKTTPVPVEGPRGVHHIPFDSQQTHIAVAFDSIPYSHDEYFLARAAVGALSGGMSSRLFSEVREKRGLCYSVNASLHTSHDRGCVIGYSGTTSDRAQETLDVMISEFHRLNEGITEEELDRVKVQVRSALVLQQESSRSRASSNSGDWFHLGRVRGPNEINDIVSALTVNEVNNYLANNPFTNFDLVTLGPQPLEMPSGVSSTTIG